MSDNQEPTTQRIVIPLTRVGARKVIAATTGDVDLVAGQVQNHFLDIATELQREIENIPGMCEIQHPEFEVEMRVSARGIKMEDVPEDLRGTKFVEGKTSMAISRDEYAIEIEYERLADYLGETPERRFSLATIMTAMHGRLLTDIGDVYEIFEWVTGQTVSTTGLLLASDRVKAELAEQFPSLAAEKPFEPSRENLSKEEVSSEIDAYLSGVSGRCGLDKTHGKELTVKKPLNPKGYSAAEEIQYIVDNLGKNRTEG